MRFMVCPLLFVFFVIPDLVFGCECRARTTCAYLPHADVVFVGKAVFTNHDDSLGGMEQKTLVRFEVEEILKGLPFGTQDAWIDPGSSSSCATSYPVGEKLLVFASGGSVMSPYYTEAYLVRGKVRRGKPLPPGIDLANPPMVYHAPLCSGTHPVILQDTNLPPEFEYLRHETDFLRELFWGRASPTVQGMILGLSTRLTDPVKVTISGMGIVRSTQADSRGFFAFENLPSGTYSVVPSLEGNTTIPPNETVSASGSTCGYVEFRMAASPAAR